MGLVIAALSEKTQMRQDDNEKEIEALAVRRAEIFARELGLTDIFFGRDSKIILTAMEEETLLRERRARQPDHSSVVKSCSTHRTYGSIWIEECPDFIVQQVHDDTFRNKE
ncbi:hypothetical protein FCV25MIE_30657 [Fagus crenata]